MEAAAFVVGSGLGEDVVDETTAVLVAGATLVLMILLLLIILLLLLTGTELETILEDGGTDE